MNDGVSSAPAGCKHSPERSISNKHSHTSISDCDSGRYAFGPSREGERMSQGHRQVPGMWWSVQIIEIKEGL